MAGVNTLVITSDNFKAEVTDATVPVLVDFWAPWCGPCRALAPLIDEVADEVAGRAKVGKVNVDDEPEIAAKFGIRSIPTLIIFRNGQAVDKQVGRCEKAVLLEKLGVK